MNIQFQAKQYTSAAEMMADAAARRKRFESAGKRPAAASVKPVESPAPFVTKRLPVWMEGVHNFDEHVTEWRKRATNMPLAYLKDRCRDFGISYQTMVGPQTRTVIVSARHQIIWEISEQFGLSLPAIGRLFGGRDHTTILYALRKIEAKRRAEA